MSKSWQSDETGLNVPFNKGERMITVHAGTKDGFIPGAKAVTKRVRLLEITTKK